VWQRVWGLGQACAAEGTDVTGFRDPQTDAERVIDPKVGLLLQLQCARANIDRF
jgi:hypothetical protein